MSTSLQIFETTLHVSTYECDFQQHWKPAAFFQRLTEAAGVHAARLGFGYETMLSQNLYWVHSRMKLKFYRFPGPGDAVTIRTWPKTIQQKLFYIRDFEVLDSAGLPLAAATSAWLVMDAGARRLIPPQSLDLQLPAVSIRAGLDEPLERIGLQPGGEERLLAQPGYSAIDLLGHVNNSRYVEWICDAFPLEHYRDHRLDWMQVNYDREVRAGDRVSLRAHAPAGASGPWLLEGFNLANEARAFEAAVQFTA